MAAIVEFPHAFPAERQAYRRISDNFTNIGVRWSFSTLISDEKMWQLSKNTPPSVILTNGVIKAESPRRVGSYSEKGETENLGFPPVKLPRAKSADDLYALQDQYDKVNKNSTKSESVLQNSNRKQGAFKIRLQESVLQTQKLQQQQQAIDKDLLASSATGKIAVVEKLLCNSYCNPNCRTRHGLTPLHYAAIHANINIFQALLKAGADPFLKNSKGLTPQDIARVNKQQGILNIIEQYCQENHNTKCLDTIPPLVLHTTGRKTSESQITPLPKYFWVSVTSSELTGPWYWKHTTYTVTISMRQPGTGRRRFTVNRRFSDFYVLYQELLALCPNPDLYNRLLLLEPRKAFFTRYSNDV
eukprot:Ihof_evm8s331 gene=Ihof_evmTU8s331